VKRHYFKDGKRWWDYSGSMRRDSSEFWRDLRKRCGSKFARLLWKLHRRDTLAAMTTSAHWELEEILKLSRKSGKDLR